MDYAYKPTTHGRAVMAACMALERPFHVTRVAFGSGRVEPDTNLANIHELLEYVSEGAVGDRRHQDDRFELTIQFANSEHKDVPTFLLSEFIVYVEDPATGEETDLLYGTLGDYRQPVPAYNPAYPPSVFNFPLTLILSDEINVSVSAPAGLVTHAELLEMMGGIGTDRLDVTIPNSGWVPDEDTGGAYALHVDLANMRITERMIPYLSVTPASLGVAVTCRLCPAVRTLDGLLRVYAGAMPLEPISASLTLVDTSWQTSGTISGSAAKLLEDVTIPVSGWAEDPETGFLSLDIPWAEASEEMIPALTILPESLDTASFCGMRQLCRALDGAVRVYADTAPAAPIAASLVLMGLSPYAYGGGTSLGSGAAAEGGALPVATTARAGVVKPGAGLKVANDGTLSVDTANEKEIDEMLDGVFPDNK